MWLFNLIWMQAVELGKMQPGGKLVAVCTVLYITPLNVTDLNPMSSKLIHYFWNEIKHQPELEVKFGGWPSTLVEAESLDIFKMELAKQKIPVLNNY